MKRFATLLLVVVAVAITAAAQWVPDIAITGDGFEMRYVDQPADYSGDVRCTVVRKLAPADTTQRALLYVHGYNDYFFQQEMANAIVAAGYDFYAIDLRKYGRSLLPANKPFEVRNINEYFADIDSAIAIIEADGNTEIALMGHSTGGLITACYMATNHPAAVKELILNSPFLDWNLGKTEWLVPAVSWIGGIFPKMKISQGMSTAYAESLLKQYHGEWDFNTEWKHIVPSKVEASWVRAIHRAQKSLRKKDVEIDVPILLMMSSRSVYGDEWSPEHNRGDGVLDVKDIKKYGIELGPDVTVHEVDGGLHDLFLSAPEIRRPLYNTLLQWMNSHF